MGWWCISKRSKTGQIYDGEKTNSYMGDGPADVMDEAISRIVGEYKKSWNRPPTKHELRACFNFCANIYDPKECQLPPIEVGGLKE